MSSVTFFNLRYGNHARHVAVWHFQVACQTTKALTLMAVQYALRTGGLYTRLLLYELRYGLEIMKGNTGHVIRTR